MNSNNTITTTVNPFVAMALKDSKARLALRSDALTQMSLAKQQSLKTIKAAKDERRAAIKACLDDIQALGRGLDLAQKELKALEGKLSANNKQLQGLTRAAADANTQGMKALADLIAEQIKNMENTIEALGAQIAEAKKEISTKKGALTKAQNKVARVQAEWDVKLAEITSAAQASAEAEASQHPAVIAWQQVLRLLERDLLSRAEYGSLRDLIAEAREVFAEDIAQQLQFLDDKRRLYGRRVDELAQSIAAGELIPAEPIPGKTAYILARGERIVAVDKKGNEIARWVIGDQGKNIFAVPVKARWWKLTMDGGRKKGTFEYKAKKAQTAAKPATASKNKKTIIAKPVAAPKVVQPAAAKPAASKKPQTKKELLHIIAEQLQ